MTRKEAVKILIELIAHHKSLPEVVEALELAIHDINEVRDIKRILYREEKA